MPIDLQNKVDKLLDDFMFAVNAISHDRQLQKGIARSQLPCSMVAILDKKSLYILAQFRSEGRFSTYIHAPEFSWSPQKINSSAQWEFGFEDPFIIKFPAILLERDAAQRRKALERIASEHIDSEFKRFIGLLSLLRTRPIFGPAPAAIESLSVFLLMPSDKTLRGNYEAIAKAAEENRMALVLAEDLQKGKAVVREMWISINQARVVIADLTGPDPSVMYALGIAHTIGKETILIYPQGSKYLTDIPKTQRIEYERSDAGRTRLGQELSEVLMSMLQPVAPW